MGGTCSKTEEEGGEKKEKVGFDSIYFDEDGNMRVGSHGRVRKGPEGEFERVLRLDDGAKSDEGRWCIIESGWVSSWLAFVYYNDSSPAPGSIDNSKLLDGKEGLAIEGLMLASDKKQGHYRLIREPVWDLYCELYKGSGPKIWVDEAPYDDPMSWQIDPGWLESQGVDLEARDGKLRKPTGVIEEAKDAEPSPVEEAKQGDLIDLFDDKPPPTAQG
eukprot:CAMPEP_0205903524 /NCGR_PEP_ID=MMETSP1325-20131115/156_1 /ASSEMBLY_ACC=CAM_ASM_000708 /TAXON_ID=236786 /ORGANISM="Florenciella sp., Strain RCC1007" /LENGTH=216 /DNA_ID=CAMNT_0053269183 /DNA_START=39 /DNA_END=689 /DNA_ORIENTATION=-